MTVGNLCVDEIVRISQFLCDLSTFSRGEQKIPCSRHLSLFEKRVFLVRFDCLFKDFHLHISLFITVLETVLPSWNCKQMESAVENLTQRVIDRSRCLVNWNHMCRVKWSTLDVVSLVPPKHKTVSQLKLNPRVVFCFFYFNRAIVRDKVVNDFPVDFLPIYELGRYPW